MGERKVMNKYLPPDFDPTQLVPGTKKKSHKVRMMMPMTVQCLECGEFIYNGKKFNALIEKCPGEDYLGIAVHRLAVRCPHCSNNITIKTDPANSDYVCETGATRTFEPWKTHTLEEDEKEALRDEARADVMWNLESKQYDAQKEMDAYERLDELRSLRSRQAGTSSESIFDAFQAAIKEREERENALTTEEEEQLKRAFESRDKKQAVDKKRVRAEDVLDWTQQAPAAPTAASSSADQSAPSEAGGDSLLGVVGVGVASAAGGEAAVVAVKKKKRKVEAGAKPKAGGLVGY